MPETANIHPAEPPDRNALASASCAATSDDTELPPLEDRIAACNWDTIDAELDEFGVGRLGRLLSKDECNALATAYSRDELFRSRVVMARHGLRPWRVQVFRLSAAGHRRDTAHLHLSSRRTNRQPVVGHAGQRSEISADARRHAGALPPAGQTRPTPLVLRYETGDYNCLHQDVYGEHLFPLQLVILLSDTADFEGGEFVLTEQRPRMQSCVEVVPLQQGEAALFPVNERPRKGTKGYHRTRLRHGVSRLRSGVRFTAGVIFPRRQMR